MDYGSYVRVLLKIDQNSLELSFIKKKKKFEVHIGGP